MLGLSKICRFGWTFTNQATPSTTPGTAVTTGASAKGSWTQVASAANVAFDVYAILINFNAGNTTATQRDLMMDIGVDPAGGTAYVSKINNILCGQAAAFLNGGAWFYFPLYVKAGSSIAIRGQGTTAGTVRAYVKLYGRPSKSDRMRSGQWSETVGTVSGNGGVSVTPGTSAAEGSWVSLGTTTRSCWWWQLSLQCSNATTTALAYMFDLAWGDATNKHMIIENLQVCLPGTAEQTTVMGGAEEGFADVPAGATLYVRASCSGSPVTGWNVLAHGIGG